MTHQVKNYLLSSGSPIYLIHIITSHIIQLIGTGHWVVGICPLPKWMGELVVQVHVSVEASLEFIVSSVCSVCFSSKIASHTASVVSCSHTWCWQDQQRDRLQSQRLNNLSRAQSKVTLHQPSVCVRMCVPCFSSSDLVNNYIGYRRRLGSSQHQAYYHTAHSAAALRIC